MFLILANEVSSSKKYHKLSAANVSTHWGTQHPEGLHQGPQIDTSSVGQKMRG